MSTRKMRIALVAMGAVAGMSPISITPSAKLAVAAACADGTCCPETGSDCFINGLLTENAYKASLPGPCKKEST